MVFYTYTDIGNAEVNEDSYGYAVYDDDAYCFAVADGLGGHGGGEIASKIAIDTVCQLFSVEGYHDDFFEKAFGQAQAAIIAEQEKRHAPSKLKTTLVMLVIHDNTAHYAHIGDSRFYDFKNKKYKFRTLDHSVPQMLVLSKEIKEKEIRNHPDRNRLMRVLGIKGEAPRYEVGKAIRLKSDHAFLLCTDGFWELVEEKDMERLLKEAADPTEWIRNMNQIIRQNGEGREMDNYTGLAVFVKGKGLFQ